MARAVNIAWSYPTSPNADRFGFDNTGCWTVQIIEGGSPPESIAAFDRAELAVKCADALRLPYHWAFMEYGHDTLKRIMRENAHTNTTTKLED